jgi:hypothetical protein
VRDFATLQAVYSGRTGAVLTTYTGWTPGWILGNAGDHDGDGADDLVSTTDGFTLELRSSATGQVIRSLTVSSPAAYPYGVWDVVGLDDLDGDGVGELVVGMAQLSVRGFTQSTNGPGQVDVLSGADGTVLQSDPGPALGGGYGGRVAAAGDLDGDGIGDYLAASAIAFAGSTTCVRALSGADGHLLLERSVPPTPLGSRGPAVALSALGDADGDGRDDFLIGVPYENAVHAVSGATGADVWSSTRSGLLGWDRYGWSVDATRDWNGDGRPDVLASSNQSQVSIQVPGIALPGPGFVSILSGADGAALSTFVGSSYGATAGLDVAALGDVNADGWPDFVTTGPGFVQVVSGNSAVRVPRSFCVSSDGTRIGHAGRPSLSTGGFALTGTGITPGHTVQFLAARRSDASGAPVGPPWWSPLSGTPVAPRPVTCLAAPSRRIGPLLVADAAGNVTLPLDLHRSPFEPGTTWSFQLVHRSAPSAGAYLSDGLRVTFEP